MRIAWQSSNMNSNFDCFAPEHTYVCRSRTSHATDEKYVCKSLLTSCSDGNEAEYGKWCAFIQKQTLTGILLFCMQENAFRLTQCRVYIVFTLNRSLFGTFVGAAISTATFDNGHDSFATFSDSTYLGCVTFNSEQLLGTCVVCKPVWIPASTLGTDPKAVPYWMLQNPHPISLCKDIF